MDKWGAEYGRHAGGPFGEGGSGVIGTEVAVM